MRTKVKSIGLVLLFVSLVGCAYFGTIQDKWARLTPDEKARIILSDIQGQLSNLFDVGKAYVSANPKYNGIWKEKIVPAFDTANRSIKTAIELGKGKGLSPSFIYDTVQPNVNSVITLLEQIGAIRKEG